MPRLSTIKHHVDRLYRDFVEGERLMNIVHTPISSRELFLVNTGQTLRQINNSVKQRLCFQVRFKSGNQNDVNTIWDVPLVITEKMRNEKWKTNTYFEWFAGLLGFNPNVKDIPVFTLVYKNRRGYVYPKSVYDWSNNSLSEVDGHNLPNEEETKEASVFTVTISSTLKWNQIPPFLIKGDISGITPFQFYHDYLCHGTPSEEMFQQENPEEPFATTVTQKFESLQNDVEKDCIKHQNVVNGRENIVLSGTSPVAASKQVLDDIYKKIEELRQLWNQNHTLWDDVALHKVMTFVNKVMETINKETNPPEALGRLLCNDTYFIANWMNICLGSFTQLVVDQPSFYSYWQRNVMGVSSRKQSVRSNKNEPSKSMSKKVIRWMKTEGIVPLQVAHMYNMWNIGPEKEYSLCLHLRPASHDGTTRSWGSVVGLTPPDEPSTPQDIQQLELVEGRRDDCLLSNIRLFGYVVKNWFKIQMLSQIIILPAELISVTTRESIWLNTVDGINRYFKEKNIVIISVEILPDNMQETNTTFRNNESLYTDRPGMSFRTPGYGDGHRPHSNKLGPSHVSSPFSGSGQIENSYYDFSRRRK